MAAQYILIWRQKMGSECAKHTAKQGCGGVQKTADRIPRWLDVGIEFAFSQREEHFYY